VTRRTFDQHCPIARALDVVGERWSLLIVRELVLGPKRYTDLRRALPGMWTNLLADRLRQLESAGVVRRRELPPPAARTVYELTDRGRQLETVLLALGGWGLPLLEADREEVPVSTAVLVGLRAFFHPEDALDETYGLQIGSEQLTALVRGGRLEFRPGRPEAPAASLRADPAALVEVRQGRLPVPTAVAAGRIRFEGEPAAVGRLRRAFSLSDLPAGG
jgi:DNA-binding HxlR family transcriptional regulator/putative sterol carrier protein